MRLTGINDQQVRLFIVLAIVSTAEVVITQVDKTKSIKISNWLVLVLVGLFLCIQVYLSWLFSRGILVRKKFDISKLSGIQIFKSPPLPYTNFEFCLFFLLAFQFFCGMFFLLSLSSIEFFRSGDNLGNYFSVIKPSIWAVVMTVLLVNRSRKVRNAGLEHE